MFNSKSYIYRFLDSNLRPIYVGKTNNLDKRFKQHFTKGHLPKECYDSVYSMEYIKVNSELNALLLETFYINKYRPKYNKLNKTYKATSIDDVNLKEIKDNWRTYRIINSNLAPKIYLSRKLTFKENFIFYSLTASFLIISAIIYFK